MSEHKAKSLMKMVEGLIESIKDYDRNFDFAKEEYHDCALTGYRDTAFGILFSLFTLGHIPSGEFHRKVCEMDKEIYKKIK